MGEASLSACEMARLCGTIPYEILTQVGARIRGSPLTEQKRRNGAALAAERLGERVYIMVQELGAIFTLFLQFLSWVLRPPPRSATSSSRWKRWGSGRSGGPGDRHVHRHGPRAPELLGVPALPGDQLRRSVVALSITRELGRCSGLMVSGRVGAAMAAELGTMKVTSRSTPW